jgi:hypothetical protein
MKRNMSGIDQTVRLGVATPLLVLLGPAGWLPVVLYVLAGVMADRRVGLLPALRRSGHLDGPLDVATGRPRR